MTGVNKNDEKWVRRKELYGRKHGLKEQRIPVSALTAHQRRLPDSLTV